MFENRLCELSKLRLMREIVSLNSSQGTVVKIGRRKFLNFSSNDYLGLAAHPDIAKAAAETLKKFGFGTGASRMLAGGSILHEQLEKRLAVFKCAESAVVFNSGYTANTGIIPAITSENDVIFSDELNHASIIDGCRLSSARTVIYKHRDISHIGLKLKKYPAARKIIITDTVFSMDGDIAPLREIYDICRRSNKSHPDSVILYLDDAHGTGVLGGGKGGLEHFCLKPEKWVVQMGTLSKALGSFGAFAAGSHTVIDWIRNRARSLIFSTALPYSVIAASIASVKMLKNSRGLVRKLWKNREILAEAIKDAGYDTMGSETPIIPVRTGSINEALRLAGFLFSEGIYAPAIRPPAVTIPRIRVTANAAHSAENIDRFIRTLKRFRDKKRVD